MAASWVLTNTQLARIRTVFLHHCGNWRWTAAVSVNDDLANEPVLAFLAR